MISASGGSNGVAPQISWTLGEPIINTGKNSSNILSQGFQQSYFVISSVEVLEKKSILSDIYLYPNPTNRFVNIAYSGEEVLLNYLILDLAGKQLQSGSLNTDIELKLDLEVYPVAIYFIHISSQDEAFYKSYKVQKLY